MILKSILNNQKLGDLFSPSNSNSYLYQRFVVYMSVLVKLQPAAESIDLEQTISIVVKLLCQWKFSNNVVSCRLHVSYHVM